MTRVLTRVSGLYDFQGFTSNFLFKYIFFKTLYHRSCMFRNLQLKLEILQPFLTSSRPIKIKSFRFRI